MHPLKSRPDEMTGFKYQDLITLFPFTNIWKALLVLFLGLILTAFAVYLSQKKAKEFADQDFRFTCNDLRIKIDARIKAHSLLLQGGLAFFAASESVSREEWRKFIESQNINKNLPGIQGIGYSLIIPKNQLTQHIDSIRRSGFPDYTILPRGDREIYTSIIYIEPFSDRNLRAFGYDMFTESNRRKAMEISRDSNYAVLSGKVILVQETDEDLQSGSLMYVPVYQNGMPATSVEERRAAIRGWVYSPYRMEDLMKGILGNWDLPNKTRIHLKIYDDDEIVDEALLYDSQGKNKIINIELPNLDLKLPIDFNHKKWTLQFAGYNENLSMFHGVTLIIMISGLIISLLLFALSLALINTNLRAKHIHLLYKKLEKLNIDKDRFISILGHDLRTPFNNLLGLSEILSEDIHKLELKEIEEIAEKLNKVSQNTFNLLEDLLIWAKTQQGTTPYKPQPINLKEIFNDAHEIINSQACIKNITVNYSIPDHINVFADINMLKTILRNLISNAIKFSNYGGVININAVENNNIVTISVSDNGIGIKPENLQKLFDFSQIYTTAGTSQETGTGLGLLLCKEFVEKHDGKIWVESEYGKGSEFNFIIPVPK